VNERQKLIPVDKLLKHFKSLKGVTVAIWGLAFKPETDDMREAPSVSLIRELLRLGAKVKAYDPVAMDNAKRVFSEDLQNYKNNLEFLNDKYEALDGSDAVILVTEWDEFRDPDFSKFEGKVVIDGRNIWNPSVVKQYARVYESIGRG
jgi:UDPglucose 6-dehydrogenase